MSATTTTAQPIAAFDPNAVPVVDVATGTTSLSITGTSTAATNVANIEIYANNVDEGSTGQLTGPAWSVPVIFEPGTYMIRGEVYGLSSETAVQDPFELITGIQGQAYSTQELNLNSQGTVIAVKDFDAAGNIIYQDGGFGSAGANAHPHISFDTTPTFESANSAILTGTITSPASVSGITIYDGSLGQTVDPTTGQALSTARALGSATISPDGSWTFDAHLSPGPHTFTAVETTFGGVTTSTQSAYELVTGVVGKPFALQEIDLSTSGSVIATIDYAADGTIVGQSASGGVNLQSGTSAGQVIRSSANDVMTGSGGSTTFAFDSGFGQDEITNFTYDSSSQPHDIVSVPTAELHSLAQVYHHITTSLDGSAVLHLNPSDSIKIDGVTKADLITHPSDFRFHS